jgi:prolyl-tRNA editing enzyme YbaK/EbsC (Cys-tRNA(Pro) deacylase)
MTSAERVAIEPGAHVIASIESLGQPYELIECDPELADTAAFCERYGVALEESGNCIVVASKKEPIQYAACLVLSHTRLDVNGTVRRLMEVRKASFASAEETASLTGMMIGGVTPFGLPETLPVYIDELVLDLETVVIGGGSRSQKLRVSPSALLALPTAVAVEGLAKVASAG